MAVCFHKISWKSVTLFEFIHCWLVEGESNRTSIIEAVNNYYHFNCHCLTGKYRFLGVFFIWALSGDTHLLCDGC